MMQTLNMMEVEQVSGALSISWNDTDTNWGSVLAWSVGGGVTAGLAGAIAGGGADYVAQHLVIKF